MALCSPPTGFPCGSHRIWVWMMFQKSIRFVLFSVKMFLFVCENVDLWLFFSPLHLFYLHLSAPKKKCGCFFTPLSPVLKCPARHLLADWNPGSPQISSFNQIFSWEFNFRKPINSKLLTDDIYSTTTTHTGVCIQILMNESCIIYGLLRNLFLIFLVVRIIATMIFSYLCHLHDCFSHTICIFF